MAKPIIFRLAGIDISLSNIGLVKFEFEYDLIKHKADLSCLYVVDENLVTTKPEKKKANVRKNCDDYDRAVMLYKAAYDFVDDCDLAFIELPVGSQSARAMASYGVSIGIAAGITNCPLIPVLPMEVKAVTGNKDLSKDAMIAWGVKIFPDIRWLRERGNPKGAIIKANEHMADAAAAVVAGLRTPDFNRLLSLHSGINKRK